ncbi:hypothetical protein ABBQ38_014236 [Trebouxia sp. C0009 RCD-2024]
MLYDQMPTLIFFFPKTLFKLSNCDRQKSKKADALSPPPSKSMSKGKRRADAGSSFCTGNGLVGSVQGRANLMHRNKALLIAQPLPQSGDSLNRPVVTSCAKPLVCDSALLQSLDTALCSCLELPYTLGLDIASTLRGTA